MTINRRLEDLEDLIYEDENPDIPMAVVVVMFRDGCCSAQVGKKEVIGSFKRVKKKIAKRTRKEGRRFYCVLANWDRSGATPGGEHYKVLKSDGNIH